ncbi:MAG: GNAT family N-acetyltransferase [bacterium]
MISDNNNQIQVVRTDTGNINFIKLTTLLDEVLRESDGAEHPFFAQFNKSEDLQNAVVVYLNSIPAGCGALKKYSDDTAEIKRMFVRPEYRGQGLAKNILKELELWSEELKYSECILETGKNLSDAIRLYQSSGYEIISNYGQYAGVEMSVCMRKNIKEKNYD